MRTLARAVDGRLAPNVEYELRARPARGVIDGSVCHVRDGVAERYPADADLAALGARSYVGVTAARLLGRSRSGS